MFLICSLSDEIPKIQPYITVGLYLLACKCTCTCVCVCQTQTYLTPRRSHTSKRGRLENREEIIYTHQTTPDGVRGGAGDMIICTLQDEESTHFDQWETAFQLLTMVASPLSLWSWLCEVAVGGDRVCCPFFKLISFLFLIFFSPA